MIELILMVALLEPEEYREPFDQVALVADPCGGIGMTCCEVGDPCGAGLACDDIQCVPEEGVR